MAKAQPLIDPQPTSADKNACHELAAKLYVANWRPTGCQFEPRAFAAMCFEGARTFLAVAGRIREGQTPEAIINHEDK